LSTYDPETRSWTVVKTSAATALGEFRNMTAGFSGEVFITGSHGIARMETLQKSGPYEWVEFDTRRMGVMNLEKAFPDQDGEAFVTGTRISAANKVLLKWQNGNVEAVYSGGKQSLGGWRGLDHSIWIVQGASTFRVTNGHKEVISRQGALSGLTYDALPETSGRFWMPTSDGLLHYTPPIWRTPEPVSRFDLPVHAIAEDKKADCGSRPLKICSR
jgi:hypothetical protein